MYNHIIYNNNNNNSNNNTHSVRIAKYSRAKDKLWTIPRAATLQVHLNHGKCLRLAARIVQSRAKYEEGLRDGREIELLPQEEEILMADWMYMEDYSKQGPWTEIHCMEMNGTGGLDTLSSWLNSDDSFDDTSPSLVFVART